MTDTGPDPDTTDTPANDPDYGGLTAPARDPFEEAVVDEEVVEEDPDDDAGDAGV
jgi:hypothetical protein